ncbi:hypothetical protein M6D93_09720 [Jatrophihabitans telluris]|uniref:Uncharacterized protein n=1 Tax=Jatrophihabitans telluris TaxID=2038343 RepID=A0ABY4R2W7_9ACTN|nr:hypothetical protein [Jatrophihabitans telluris]UQX90258.1 hypothetical protein M6D93_09720 [Jatrophihabitans telluris]
MTWFRRGTDGNSASASAAAAQAADSAADSPATLRAELFRVVRFVNQNSGRLPPAAVVDARRVTDTLREIIDTSEVRPLDVYAIVSLRGALEDYLPTTLRSYLAVEPNLIDTARISGLTPRQSLLEQLASLQTAASAVLLAAQNQDVDALMTQGNFLRTKFSGSDLDL